MLKNKKTAAGQSWPRREWSTEKKIRYKETVKEDACHDRKDRDAMVLKGIATELADPKA